MKKHEMHSTVVFQFSYTYVCCYFCKTYLQTQLMFTVPACDVENFLIETNNMRYANNSSSKYWKK